MALQIKGLTSKAVKARANIDALHAAYDKFNETAPAHVADVEGLTAQVTEMQSDMEFAANILGNSTERVETKPKDVVIKVEGQLNPPEVGLPPTPTFRPE